MIQQKQQLEYSVHPESQMFASSPDIYDLADSASHPSVFTLRLKMMLQKLLHTKESHDADSKTLKIDRYERG